MRSVLYCSDVLEMSEPRARVSRISIWIANWPLRRWTRRNQPFPARDLGLQKAISQDRTTVTGLNTKISSTIVLTR